MAERPCEGLKQYREKAFVSQDKSGFRNSENLKRWMKYPTGITNPWRGSIYCKHEKRPGLLQAFAI